MAYVNGSNTSSSLSTLRRLHVWLYEADVRLTRLCSVCATRRSAFGSARRLIWLVEVSGTGYVWITGAVLVILLGHSPHVLQFAVNLLAGLMLDLAIVGTLKALVRRRRPEIGENDMLGVIAVDKFSFPSGHATRAVMVSLMLVAEAAVVADHPTAVADDPLVAAAGAWWRMWWMCCILAWCALVCGSRVALGRHHVSDLVCGVMIGAAQYLVLLHYCWVSRETAINSISNPVQRYYRTVTPLPSAHIK